MAYTYILTLYLACQLTSISRAASLRQVTNEGLETEEAISRLSKVFEIDSPPDFLRHRTPPEYMTNLYKSIAEPTSGITKASGPFDADVIRGFPDRDSSQQMHFQFNVSFIKAHEKVLETEFHLFKLRPRYSGNTWRELIRDTRPAHLTELRVYQVLDEDRIYHADGLKLIDYRRVSAHAHGWQVFRVGEAVAEWLNGTKPNHGILVTAHSLSGRPVNGTVVRFAQRGQHHDRIQPVLVVFSADGRGPRRRNYISAEEAEFERQVQMLNEANWASAEEEEEEENLDNSYRQRRKRSTDDKIGRRNRKHVCSKSSMYVDFEQIGWSDWIISPKGYDAHQCKGDCPFPLGQNQKPTNHATVQSIVHALRIVNGVNTPCCVPNKLYSISLLYFDDSENVILKQYDDMVAATCGCH